jgi:hypothetical protein
MKKYKYKYRTYVMGDYKRFNRHEQLENMLNDYGKEGYEIDNFDVETVTDKKGNKETVLHVIFKMEEKE